MNLLTDKNAKVLKSVKYGYETFILHLAPASRSGYNVCPNASAGCMASCLNTSGRGCYQKTQNARVRRTKLLFESRFEFFMLLIADIYTGIRRAKKHGLIPCFRLNGTSDICWENELVPHTSINIFQVFPNVVFYDYSAITSRQTPTNYHLTFSRKENNESDVISELTRGGNVAVVFGGKMPETYLGYPVFIGDDSDLRFLDPKNVIIGLTAKGKARRDRTGFVVW
jgi:hypothetical protein